MYVFADPVLFLNGTTKNIFIDFFGEKNLKIKLGFRYSGLDDI